MYPSVRGQKASVNWYLGYLEGHFGGAGKEWHFWLSATFDVRCRLAIPRVANYEPVLPLAGEPVQVYGLHSSKLTWMWRGALFKSAILYTGPSMSFHVYLGEGKEHGAETLDPSDPLYTILYALLEEPGQDS